MKGNRMSDRKTAASTAAPTPAPDARQLAQRIVTTMPTIHGFMKHNWQHHGTGSPPKMIILTLLEKGPMTQAELIDHTRLQPSAMSKAIDVMEQKGYLQREIDLADRRRMVISLTKDGRKKLDALREMMLSRLVESLEDLSAADRVTVYNALAIMKDIFGAQGRSACGHTCEKKGDSQHV
jgi:DNA-binding MarR family transcriptional regulator